MNKEVKIIGNELYMNDKSVAFSSEISKFIVSGDVVVVLLKIPQGKKITIDDCLNLYGLNFNGEIIWQVELVSKGLSSQFQYSPIVNIAETDDKQLIAVDFMGRRFEVNKYTGQMTISGFTK
ncbi:hypothetical protein [Streptococcus ferus]|uniref:hypothetical protein n=1 Tax=Streptococcus ferus TaxID=1345 RepID=UPI002357AA63|nr:hypothetical protein [Streptococcus ferus]